MQSRPYLVKKGGEKEEGRRREGGGGEREAGSGNSARAPNAPVPGLQGAQRAPPGPRPPDALPDTTLLGAWTTAHHDCCTRHFSYRAGHYNEHYFPAPDIAPRSLLPALDTNPPSSARAQTSSPQRVLVVVLLHLSAGHCLLPVPFFPLIVPHLYRVLVGAPSVSQIPCCSGNAARAPIPRLLARMPLPGGLWWLLCCRRGFTLLHRDYGDGELSGDGDEDEDDETFELRTPSPAGGGRVSLEGFRTVFNPSYYNHRHA